MANDTLGLDTTQRITDALIAQYISQNGSITEEQVQAIETLVQTQNAINAQALVAADSGVADREININLIRNVSTDSVTDTTLPNADQGDTAIQTVEVTANTSVSRAIRDSLGIPNQGPIVEKLISKAIDLGLNQIPGYSEINRAIGTANKIVSIGDIATNVDLSPAETALALARLFVPQINLVVQGFNLVTGGDGGGGSGVAEALVPIPVDTETDPQAGGASGRAESAFGLANSVVAAPVGNFAVTYNVETGNYDVYNLETNELVAGGFTQEQATEYADALALGDNFGAFDVQRRADAEARLNEGPADVTITQDPSLYPNGLPYDDDGNLNPGWSLDENNNPVWVGENSDGTLFVEPATAASASASFQAAQTQAKKQQAQAQAKINSQRKQANDGDWRVKIRLAGASDYLYNDPALTTADAGILYPLKVTDGVVFPYTPQIQTSYSANYSTSDLTHSNYRGLFYQNSHVDEVNIQATFTAQDTAEAEYMLAVIHFFRSVTKMFYGQDGNRGVPPPLVFLQGLGEFQFNLHPCVVRTFNYTLPADVDYIRARSKNLANVDNLLFRRDRNTVPLPGAAGTLSRLLNALPGGLPAGAIPTATTTPPTLGINRPTYVPTKIDISLVLLPVQSRQQMSEVFSLKNYASGQLITKGFW